ncbi:hypothetical protein [Candidatus Palauibacter sp.]|uniref:hypothetical protein n=1 Tax=Candidatus Palauibacter sp. TaxID=3101350 RepID=UPI003C6F358F
MRLDGMETDTMGILGVLLAVVASAISLALFTRGATNKLDDRITELRGEVGKVRTELGGEIGKVRTELSGEIGKVRTELSRELGKVRTEVIETRVTMTDRVARLEGNVFGTPPPEAAAETG